MEFSEVSLRGKVYTSYFPHSKPISMSNIGKGSISAHYGSTSCLALSIVQARLQNIQSPCSTYLTYQHT